jgi:sugar-specific transcriptional regulator TrmB
MTVEEVRDEISDDVDEYKARLRETLRNREREQTEFGPTLEEDDVVRELSDAVSESLLGFPVS